MTVFFNLTKMVARRQAGDKVLKVNGAFMQKQNIELQLVALHGRKATTTSLKVAEIFGKQHKNVLRDIERLMADLPENSWLNFGLRNYTDNRGKVWPMYEMTRDGFSLLAMGFTGKQALEWKLKYLTAFNAMEQALLNQQNLSWQESRSGNKQGRREETDVIARFVAYATAQGSQNAEKYYVNLTGMTYKALFLVGSASAGSFRDLLDAAQISFLTTAEYLVRDALEEGMRLLLPYKEIYQMARERVTGFAGNLPRFRLEARAPQTLLFGGTIRSPLTP